MDEFNDSSELYTIRNQFYSNQHNAVISYSLDQFSSQYQLKVLEFQIRSTVALGQDASELIDHGKVLFPEEEELFQLLSAHNDLQSFGTDSSTYFQDVKQGKFELQTVLTAIYLVKYEQDVNQAVSILNEYINSDRYNIGELEPFLILMNLYLYLGKIDQAAKLFEHLKIFPSFIRDSIIYHTFEAWYLAVKGESDNINNSYYFYDELLNLDYENDPIGKQKILTALFALTLQMRHLPEAQELLNQIRQLNVTSGDFIANEICYNYLTGSNDTRELLQQLYQIEPNHQLLQDFAEKTKVFDEIVGKYTA
ncbi:uncharacterized protein SPAPADRAFT_61007 [Spathaspora passalidarum NRRL Y-27907]|uniref:Coatomer subunit epsilon n=1 Tax=Spathaspora passalidarum (strain NRRL Y-27907 / 11-Y1) TaxID=619300 RepID=G3AN61_SPAPN|nr:uncharacterized protein SPAPADRAFT_61007 [Spathaspora passalidarum NRRL Y-27907]EGW31904.1 hypothetical protein SPAPADRAFT_61007 [Spathaspora passalidarum NRRL Y-27907]